MMKWLYVRFFREILEKLCDLQKGQRRIMASIEEVNSSVDKLTTDTSTKLQDISAEIAALKAAGGATTDQLGSLKDKVDTLDAAVTGFSTT